MLHLMLVDDEPLAVDYLFDAIQEWKQYELTVTKAYSGIHAMDKMNDMRLDILLTDIRMPGMNGLELADRVREQWPRCKIIFYRAIMTLITSKPPSAKAEPITFSRPRVMN